MGRRPPLRWPTRWSRRQDAVRLSPGYAPAFPDHRSCILSGLGTVSFSAEVRSLGRGELGLLDQAPQEVKDLGQILLAVRGLYDGLTFVGGSVHCKPG